jgi:uncharacterized membrane protein SpoIIM required for sporulation
MTLENIRNGDPTGVYKDADAVYMFFRIAFNNLRIDVLAFVSGIFLGWGTLSVVFTNGVMLGAFFMLFYQHNVHADAWRIILIHGTIEILTIIISAAAGLTLGGGILFPGTYKRLTAFRMGATRGLKIMLGVLPFTIIAAILESFVTRYSDMNLALNLFIIIGSLALMIGYFFVYPIMLHRQGKIAVEVEE